MRLADILSIDRVTTSMHASDKDGVLRAIARMFPDLDESEVLRVLVERERLASTGVGSGVAIPHGRMRGAEKIVAALALAPRGVPFDAVDGQPATIFVAVLAPERHTGDHLKALARISRVLRDATVRDRLLAAPDASAALEVVVAEDMKH